LKVAIVLLAAAHHGRRLACAGWAAGVAGFALLGAIAWPASAQQEAPPAALPVEKVEVTGSHIKRTENEGATPLQIITKEEMQRGGMQTAQDLMDRVSAHQSFGAMTEALGVGNAVAGSTTASLRGLGDNRTLVLLNGRRPAPYALGALNGGASVDLSAIPAAAIERVEILKDGASAIYGSDAIAGVINFILRKDFQGVEVNANYFGTQHGGGENWRANATAGYGSLARDGFNVLLTADYFSQQALRAADREFTNTAYRPSYGIDLTSGNSFPANITQRGGFGSTPRNPTIPSGGATPDSCLPPNSYPTYAPQPELAFRAFTCRYDYTAVIDTIPQSEKSTVLGRLTWQIWPELQFFAEGSYYRGQFLYKISPTPVNSGFTNTPMTLPPSSPYYPRDFVLSLPGGNPDLPVRLAYRTLELGARTDRFDVEQWRGIAGLQGRKGDWDYDFVVGYNGNQQIDNMVSGSISEERFGPLLRSGAINPFGPNTPETIALMRATQIVAAASDSRAKNIDAELRISGNLLEMAAGPLAVAVGLGGRREELIQTNAPFINSGDVIGGTVAPSLAEVRRVVGNMYVEVNAPLTPTLEANIAVRYDHYSDFGSTTNPKLTLRWQPTRDLVLRGSYGSGFRAPTLSDVFQPDLLGFVGDFDDPLRCPVTQSEDDCAAFYTARSGGNPQLKPETSRQLNLGLVLEPLPGLSASVDYYRIQIDDVITKVPDFAIFADYDRWAPTHIFRKPPDAQYPGLPGPIDYVFMKNINGGSMLTSGIDIDLRYRSPVSGLGQFWLALTGTYVLEYKVSEFEPVVSGPGTGDLGAISRWRHYLTLDWMKGPWGATLAQTFQLGHTEPDLLTCGDVGTISTCTGTRHVGSSSVWDLQGRYTGFPNLRLSLGVRNLFDTAPPLTVQANTFQVGYDPTSGDPRGRMYYVAVQYAFK
jgi:iron complex outermembrane receptor protein